MYLYCFIYCFNLYTEYIYFGSVGVVGWGREEGGGGGSHFLMLSRRAAVLYCVAWGLFSPANLSMLHRPAWLWPPDALYRATTKAGECCIVLQLAPPPLLYSKLLSPHSPPTPPHTLAYTRQSSLLWAPGRCVSLTERDRRQSLINHVYAAGAQNII